MKVIDSHVHIGKMIGFEMLKEDVLYSMERYGIDFSLVSNIEAAEFDHHGALIPARCQFSQFETAKQTIAFAENHPERIGAAIWIKPYGESCDVDFCRMLQQHREVIFALKLHPFHSRVAPDDRRLEPYYALAEELDLSIVSHTGGCEEAKSVHLLSAAKAHPKLNFVMVHMDLGTDNRAALDLLGKADNLYGDTTWVPISTTLEAVRRYGSEKMLFGSDNPVDGKDTYAFNRTGDRSLYQAYFNEFREMVPRSDFENIMHKNAERLFGIKI